MSIVIGFPQSQIDDHWWTRWIRAAWQPGLEDGVRVNKGAEEQPNLDAAIRDWECAKLLVLN